MPKFEDIIANLPKSCEIRFANSVHATGIYGPPERATLVLGVSSPKWGFGEFTFIQDEKGQLYLDTECSSVDTVIEALAEWIKGAITDHNQDPEKHKRYNEVRGSVCGEHCKICHE